MAGKTAGDGASQIVIFAAAMGFLAAVAGAVLGAVAAVLFAGYAFIAWLVSNAFNDESKHSDDWYTDNNAANIFAFKQQIAGPLAALTAGALLIGLALGAIVAAGSALAPPTAPILVGFGGTAAVALFVIGFLNIGLESLEVIS